MATDEADTAGLSKSVSSLLTEICSKDHDIQTEVINFLQGKINEFVNKQNQSGGSWQECWLLEEYPGDEQTFFLGEHMWKSRAGYVHCVLCSCDIGYSHGVNDLVKHLLNHVHSDILPSQDTDERASLKDPREIDIFHKVKHCWSDDWLADLDLLDKKALRVFVEPGSACCVLCVEAVSYGEIGRQAITEHIDSAQHQQCKLEAQAGYLQVVPNGEGVSKRTALYLSGLKPSLAEQPVYVAEFFETGVIPYGHRIQEMVKAAVMEAGGDWEFIVSLHEAKIEFLVPVEKSDGKLPDFVMSVKEAAKSGHRLDTKGKSRMCWKQSWMKEMVEGEMLEEYIRKCRLSGLAYCSLCALRINYGCGGFTRLSDHIKTKKHRLAYSSTHSGKVHRILATKHLGEGHLRHIDDVTASLWLKEAVETSAGSWNEFNRVINQKVLQNQKITINEMELDQEEPTVAMTITKAPSEIEDDDLSEEVREEISRTPQTPDTEVRRSTRKSRGRSSVWKRGDYVLTPLSAMRDEKAETGRKKEEKAENGRARKRKAAETPEIKQEVIENVKMEEGVVEETEDVIEKGNTEEINEETEKESTADISFEVKLEPGRKKIRQSTNSKGIKLQLGGKVIFIPEAAIPDEEDEELMKFPEIQRFVKEKKLSLGATTYPMLEYLKEKGLIPQDSKRRNKKSMNLVTWEEVSQVETVMEDGIEQFLCRLNCGYRSKFRSAVHFHMRESHRHEKQYKCPQCELLFPQVAPLSAHVQNVHMTGSFPCSKCSHVSKSRLLLTAHIRNIHENSGFICDLCGVTLRSSGTLREHMNIHYDRKPYKCLECGAAFPSSSRLHAHLHSHGERRYSCPQCGKKFASSDKLRLHKMIHTGERSHKCSNCNYATYTRDNLKKHCLNKHGVVLPIVKHRVAKVNAKQENKETLLTKKQADLEPVPTKNPGYKDLESLLVKKQEAVESFLAERQEVEEVVEEVVFLEGDNAELQEIGIPSEALASGSDTFVVNDGETETIILIVNE